MLHTRLWMCPKKREGAALILRSSKIQRIHSLFGNRARGPVSLSARSPSAPISPRFIFSLSFFFRLLCLFHSPCVPLPFLDLSRSVSLLYFLYIYIRSLRRRGRVDRSFWKPYIFRFECPGHASLARSRARRTHSRGASSRRYKFRRPPLSLCLRVCCVAVRGEKVRGRSGSD